MNLRMVLLSVLLTAGSLNLAWGAGYDAWVGPGDVPEMTPELFQMLKARQPLNRWLDETDDSTGYDVHYYNVEIRFFPATHQVVGHVDMLLEATTALSYIDLSLRSNMVVDSAIIAGSQVAHSFVGLEGLRLTLSQPMAVGDTVTASIYYQGYPISGSMGALSWGTHLGTYIISSLSQPNGARTWWPCKDVTWDKADSARLVWTVPNNLFATGNGLLQGITQPEPGWKSYEWFESYPITTYLIAATATNFAHFRNWYVTALGDSVPLDHYVYPEDSLDATLDFADLDEVITFFASVFEEYPFLDEKYGHVEFPWSGGMEHQTLTSLGASLINGMGTYHWIIVHELSHQWWGDMVTCETWMDIWLNEGFATYCDALWTQYDQGQTAFINRMNSFKQTYMQSEPYQGRFPIYDPEYMWGGTVYQKGAWVLHMIRYVIGEDNFWDFWPEYRSRFAFDNVTDAEFQQTLEDVTGMDLDWFFWEWVYMAGYPEYEWGWQATPMGDSTRVDLSVHQVQDLIDQTPIFTMPVQIEVVTNTGSEIVIADDSLAVQNFSYVVGGTVQDVLFDPDQWILKTALEGAYVPLPLNVTLTPVNPPIQIPAAGGSFNYNVTLTNNLTTPQTFDAWIMTQLPNGTWYGPLLGPVNLTLTGSSNITRLRTQNVPAGAPAGTYSYNAYVGVYPDSITDGDSFTFEKLTTGDNLSEVGDWGNTGEDFEASARASQLPLKFRLDSAHPNPFNPSTTLTFTLPQAAKVTLNVYDVTGRLVASLVNGWRGPGKHEVVFDGSALSSGVYLYWLEAGDFTAGGKMVLVK